MSHEADRPTEGPDGRPWVDALALVAALAVVVTVIFTNDANAPDWNPFSVVALLSVPLLIRHGLVIDSPAGALRVSTAPVVLFADPLPDSLVFLPWWAVVVVGAHTLFFGWHRGVGRGSVEVLAAAAMAVAVRSIDTPLWPVDRAIVATVVYVVTMVALELLRSGTRSPRRVLAGVRTEDAAMVAGGMVLACSAVILIREAARDAESVSSWLLAAACLAVFVLSQVLLARMQGLSRGVDALIAAERAMPWPSGRIDTMLVEFVHRALRTRNVSISPDPGGPGELTASLGDRGHLVADRVPGDLPFNRNERRLFGSLAALATSSRQIALQEEQLRHQATTDDLTGLNTYAHFRYLVESRGMARSAANPVAVAFLDLDGFKALNTELGHLDSDLVLATIGERFRRRLPDGVEVCRFGGDEFIALTDTTAGLADGLVERITGLVEEPLAVGDRIVQVRASLGVATSADTAESIDDVVRRAEARMREAKSLRKAPQTAARSDVLGHLLERDGFTVVLQPLVQTGTGELEGVEALVRVADQTYGQLSPLIVVDSAQRLDLMDDVTAVVAQRAVAATREINRVLGRSITVTVNIEFDQLREDSDLLASLEQLVADSGVLLALEVSERQFHGWTEAHTLVARRLRDAGIPLVVDDFGAGYATYSLLNKWRWALVKIDRDLVVAATPTERRLLGHVCNLMTDLGLNTVAEGVETEEQWDFVHELGVGWVQGWAAAPPLSPDALLEHLERSTRFPAAG